MGGDLGKGGGGRADRRRGEGAAGSADGRPRHCRQLPRRLGNDAGGGCPATAAGTSRATSFGRRRGSARDRRGRDRPPRLSVAAGTSPPCGGGRPRPGPHRVRRASCTETEEAVTDGRRRGGRADHAPADHIDLLPPGKEMILSENRPLLTDRDPDQTLSLPTDRFFAGLARDRGRHAVAVILSGTGRDGSRGLVRVRGAGGLVIAQTAETAEFGGMPRAAFDTGAVHVASPLRAEGRRPADRVRVLRRPAEPVHPAGDAGGQRPPRSTSPPVTHPDDAGVSAVLGIDFNHAPPVPADVAVAVAGAAVGNRPSATRRAIPSRTSTDCRSPRSKGKGEARHIGERPPHHPPGGGVLRRPGDGDDGTPRSLSSRSRLPRSS